MVIFTLFIFTVLAFVSLMMIHNLTLRTVAVVVSAAIAVSSIVLIIVNMHDHYGMKVQTKTTKTQIYSVQGQNTYGILSYQPVGTSGKEKVYIYRATDKSTKATIAKPDLKTTTSLQNIDGNVAYKVTTNKTYVYRNSFFKFLFGIADNNHELKSSHVTYQVPPTWIALSSQDGERLKTLVAGLSTQSDFIQQVQQEKEQATTDPDGAAKATVDYYKNLLATTPSK
ncbi:DUF4811 domain-containing protein [Fructobacillus ficulneus]|uniref:DUF4811 domain-containing protein n=1 Tax=Fructobacillus ficulneus TaxID=157463 RepID=A0A0K8MF45_9LACO|nr:DUF4811 domain-containing protein [Fructobacillus ficulneus]GAO99161.1 hypothetical protein FFIC_080060 [Fructobacillus ficulneus]